jgi:hypothetical protein
MTLEAERKHFVHPPPLLQPKIPLTTTRRHKQAFLEVLRKEEMLDKALRGQF